MTKIDIISGFLGAGKTTLIKKLISESYKGEKLVLVENEFGEIGVDGSFMQDAGIEVSEINSGCICCSLVGDFREALAKVVADYAPDRIIIEPSGVGKLSDVIRAAKDADIDGKAELNSFTAVVDGTKAKMYMKNFGEFFNDQIENASSIILSRTQKMDEAKLEAAVALLREHNPDATIITTPWDDLSGDVIRSAMEKKNDFTAHLMEEAKEAAHHHHHDHEHDEHCTCGCHDHDHDHHHHHADEVFVNWGRETPKKFDRDALDAILAELAKEDSSCGFVLRAKGILQNVGGGWMQFDLTPGEYEIREGSASYTGLVCVIGTNLDEHKLSELFGL